MIRGVYGNGRAGEFIRDCIAGRNSVDIVVCGDSNSGFNGGYGKGWNAAMVAAGAPIYGTGIIPCASGSTGASIVAYDSVGFAVYNGRYVGQSGGSAFLADGSSLGVTEIDDQWNGGAGEFRPFAQAAKWMSYDDQGGNPDIVNGVGISVKTTCPTSITENWISRVGAVHYPTGSGYWVSRWVAEASPYTTIAAEQINTNRALGRIDIQTFELAIGADAARNANIRAARYTDGNTGGLLDGFTMAEPAGFVFESVYVRQRGFAVTQFQHYSSGTTTAIADGVEAAGGTINTYLREIRNRQLLAGGTGRVVVWLNSGVNGGPAVASNWTDGATKLRDEIKAAWAGEGFDPTDLAFLFSVTHPTASSDTMSATRTAAQSWVVGKDDTVFVDLAEMVGYTYLNANALYDAAGNTHLIEAGYTDVLGQVIDNITEDATMTRFTPIFNAEQTVPSTTPMTAYTGAAYAGPCVAELSARLSSNNAATDFYINTTTTTTNRVFVEASSQPFRIAVDDLSELHLQGISADTIISVIAYPIGTLVP